MISQAVCIDLAHEYYFLFVIDGNGKLLNISLPGTDNKAEVNTTVP